VSTQAERQQNGRPMMLGWPGRSRSSAPVSEQIRRRPIYIAIGIGEIFSAIDAPVTVIAQDRIPGGDDVVATWLDCHRGQDAEPGLRHLAAEVKLSASTDSSRRSVTLLSSRGHWTSVIQGSVGRSGDPARPQSLRRCRRS
jgi:hypothetical protein